jgi:hypothetical protein
VIASPEAVTPAVDAGGATLLSVSAVVDDTEGMTSHTS